MLLWLISKRFFFILLISPPPPSPDISPLFISPPKTLMKLYKPWAYKQQFTVNII